MPAQIDVELETVTPLFMGGADPLVPEVRSSSFRGELRYWYRALAAESSLAELKKRETAVFGDAGRASLVLVHAEAIGRFEPQDWRQVSAPPRGGLSEAQRLGLGYLGFAFRPPSGPQALRCIPPGTRIHLALQARRNSDEPALRHAYAALWLLVNLGGLGTRSRRGLGGIAVRSERGLPDLPPLGFPGGSPADLRSHLREGLQGLRNIVPAAPPPDTALAEYSILSRRHAVLLIANPEQPWASWQATLGDFSRRMGEYRKSLYPQMGDLTSSARGTEVAQRAAFGLPIPYFNPKTHESTTLQPAGGGEEAVDRRASPLLWRVAALAPNQFTVVLTYFSRSRFLPPGVRVLRAGRAETLPPVSLVAVSRFLEAANQDVRFLQLEIP